MTAWSAIPNACVSLSLSISLTVMMADERERKSPSVPHAIDQALNSSLRAIKKVENSGQTGPSSFRVFIERLRFSDPQTFDLLQYVALSIPTLQWETVEWVRLPQKGHIVGAIE